MSPHFDADCEVSLPEFQFALRRRLRLGRTELTVAAKVIVSGVTCCDGDGGATATWLTAAKVTANSSLLRRRFLSAAVATGSATVMAATSASAKTATTSLLQRLSDVDGAVFGDGSETARNLSARRRIYCDGSGFSAADAASTATVMTTITTTTMLTATSSAATAKRRRRV
nr:hypothetical protein Iba_chr08dCG4980 [Ipomoea batatas]